MAAGTNRPAPLQITPHTVPGQLAINVIYTDGRATLTALRHAAALAFSLNARIRILLPAITPYPLPLEKSPVCRAHHQLILRTVANETHIEAAAVIVHCREYADLSCVMPPHSIVIVGGRRRWWQPWGAGNAIERALSAAGHHVIRVRSKENTSA